MKILLRLFLTSMALAALLAGYAYAVAVSDPVVRRARIALPDWPAGAPPVRAVLVSDIHVGGPDMPPERLSGIVAAINALRPDIVLIAGDFVSDKTMATRRYSTDAAMAPLAALRPRLRTVAVLGNHDHWRDEEASRRALEAAGVVVLDNEAIAVGPLAVGGIDDAFTDHHDTPRTLQRMRALPGARLLLSHSPDPFATLPADVGLMVAGHTHCGQISLPLWGPLTTFSEYGNRYACGLIRERGRTLVVSAGLGTSVLPLRIGAPPDLWLLELGPDQVRRSALTATRKPASRNTAAIK
jgi:predicted MPP superfamily phosphohydrolase